MLTLCCWCKVGVLHCLLSHRPCFQQRLQPLHTLQLTAWLQNIYSTMTVTKTDSLINCITYEESHDSDYESSTPAAFCHLWALEMITVSTYLPVGYTCAASAFCILIVFRSGKGRHQSDWPAWLGSGCACVLHCMLHARLNVRVRLDSVNASAVER